MRYLTLILVLAAFQSWGQNTTWTIKTQDSLKFISTVSFQDKTLTRVKLKLGVPIPVYLPKGQNMYPNVVTIEEPADTSVQYIVRFSLEKVGAPPVDPPDTIPVITDIPSIIDNVPSGVVVYTGTGWGHPTGSTDNLGGTWLNGTFSYNNANNSYVTITWTGFRIQVYTELKNTHGKVGISINNGAEKIKDLYTTGTLKGQMVYDTAFTTHATRTIKIRTTDTKNPASTQFWNILDYVKVYRKSNETGAVTPPPVIPPVDPPPTGNVVNISPGQNIPTNSASGTTIKLTAGTWTQPILNIPSGVTIEGSGRGQTIVKGSVRIQSQDSKNFLFNFRGGSGGGIKNLTIDGDNKTLNGGVLMDGRSNFTVENVEVLRTYFCGIWVLNANNVAVKNVKTLDSSWGSSGWCSGNIQFGNCTNLDISNFDISENVGYGMKSLGHTNESPLTNVKIHDGRISVNPRGAWNNGSAPNITLEIWASSFPGSEIYNNYFDNTVSLVNVGAGVRASPLKLYNNIFDINGPRAGGYGYAVELSINDAEVYGNWFNGGSAGLVNWHIKQCAGWNIHHNTFYNIGRMVNSQCKASAGAGLKDVTLAYNTVEMNSGVTAFLELNKSNGDNITIKNNLFWGTSGSPKVVSAVNGATMTNSVVKDNWYFGSVDTSIPGATVINNSSGDPLITASGNKPSPFYRPLSASPLLPKDIGALR